MPVPHNCAPRLYSVNKPARYEQAIASSDDAEVKRLARELAGEEMEHIAWLEDALKKAPRPLTTEADYEALFSPSSPR